MTQIYRDRWKVKYSGGVRNQFAWTQMYPHKKQSKKIINHPLSNKVCDVFMSCNLHVGAITDANAKRGRMTILCIFKCVTISVRNINTQVFQQQNVSCMKCWELCIVQCQKTVSLNCTRLFWYRYSKNLLIKNGKGSFSGSLRRYCEFLVFLEWFKWEWGNSLPCLLELPHTEFVLGGYPKNTWK